jgi:hypothetical protein
MRKWLYDNPWIWIVVFLAVLVAGSMATLVIAQLNRPEIVKEKKKPRTAHHRVDDARPVPLRLA